MLTTSFQLRHVASPSFLPTSPSCRGTGADGSVKSNYETCQLRTLLNLPVGHSYSTWSHKQGHLVRFWWPKRADCYSFDFYLWGAPPLPVPMIPNSRLHAMPDPRLCIIHRMALLQESPKAFPTRSLTTNPPKRNKPENESICTLRRSQPLFIQQ